MGTLNVDIFTPHQKEDNGHKDLQGSSHTPTQFLRIIWVKVSYCICMHGTALGAPTSTRFLTTDSCAIYSIGTRKIGNRFDLRKTAVNHTLENGLHQNVNIWSLLYMQLGMQKGGWHQVWLPTLRRSSDLRWLKAQPLLLDFFHIYKIMIDWWLNPCTCFFSKTNHSSIS